MSMDDGSDYISRPPAAPFWPSSRPPTSTVLERLSKRLLLLQNKRRLSEQGTRSTTSAAVQSHVSSSDTDSDFGAVILRRPAMRRARPASDILARVYQRRRPVSSADELIAAASDPTQDDEYSDVPISRATHGTHHLPAATVDGGFQEDVGDSDAPAYRNTAQQQQESSLPAAQLPPPGLQYPPSPPSDTAAFPAHLDMTALCESLDAEDRQVSLVASHCSVMGQHLGRVNASGPEAQTHSAMYITRWGLHSGLLVLEQLHCRHLTIYDIASCP